MARKKIENTSPTPTKKTTPRKKVLNWKSIETEAKALEKYTEHKLDKDGTKVIKYHKEFSEKLIQDLLTELHEHIKYNDKNEIGYFNNYFEFTTYVNFLIIKYFTNLKDDFKDSSLEDNINLLVTLAKTKYFRLFFEDVFEPQEVEKVFERINELDELIAKIDNLQDKLKEDLSQQIKQPEVREKFKLN